MALLESQRLAYLQELGIQTYFPRRALPGAKPSNGYSTNSLSAEKTRINAQRETANDQESRLSALRRATSLPVSAGASAASLPESGTAHAGLEQARALLINEQRVAAEIKSTSRAETAESAAPPVSVMPPSREKAERITQEVAPEVASETAVNFVFAYFAVNDDVAVVNELPWAGNAQVRGEHKVLLAKILSAISVDCSPETLAPVVFRWPIEGMPDDLEGQSARNMLEGFMARRLKIKPARFLLVLAEQSSQYMFPADFSKAASAEGFATHPRLPCQVLVTRSLDAMMASRQVKSVVWSALQPLKQMLERPALSPTDPI